MAIGGAFLGGGVEVVPAGSCKLELEILTEDRANLAATFTIRGTSTYTVTAGADGRAVYTVPSGQTYTVSVNTTGYDNIASQTVVAESGTVRYVRFEAFEGRVKRSGDTMTGGLSFRSPNQIAQYIDNQTLDKTVAPSSATTIWYVQTRDKNFQPFGNVIAHSMEVDGSVRWTFGQNATTWEGLTVVKPLSGQPYATAPATPTNATDNEITTANWVNGKLSGKSNTGHTHDDRYYLKSETYTKTEIDTKVGGKNKVTNVTSYSQLMNLIKNGKRGDSFGLTMDYTGSSIGGITASGINTHAFGHYTLEELTVTDGNLSSFQAFGSGEISGKFIENDNATYTYATTGFGRERVLQGYGTAFRVVEDGKLTYFLTVETTTSFDGYYISI